MSQLHKKYKIISAILVIINIKIIKMLNIVISAHSLAVLNAGPRPGLFQKQMIKILKEIFVKSVIENSIFIKFFNQDKNKFIIRINRFLDL